MRPCAGSISAARWRRRRVRNPLLATPRRRFSRVENLSVVYGKAQALENVSLHVHRGEFVAVVGLNGAGKTTLFNAISGLIPYAGDIRREGRPLRGRTAATIAREGIVQSPEGRDLFGLMTVQREPGHGRTSARGQGPGRAQRDWLFNLFPILKERRGQTAGLCPAASSRC